MPELIAVVLFLVAISAIEIWYVRHHQTTISEHVQDLMAQMSTQLVAGIFFALGVVAGWFVAHFTDVPPH